MTDRDIARITDSIYFLMRLLEDNNRLPAYSGLDFLRKITAANTK